jgi:tetratricopeptide (TPR) repeat protein
LGVLLAQQRRPLEAEAAFREVIRLNPQFAVAHLYLGVLMTEQGRPLEADAALREAYRIDPSLRHPLNCK